MAWKGADVTVACNVRDGAAHVEGWSASLRSQTCRGFRVLVLDDGSVDGTPERVEAALNDAHVLRRPARGLQAARRDLLGSVRTPLVLLVDIDLRLSPDGLERLLAAMEEGVAAVSGRIRNREPRRPAQAHDAVRQVLYRRRTDRRGHAQWLEGSPTLWRKEVVDRLGGPASGAVSEDLDLSFRARRAGLRLVLLPGTLATHPDPATWAGLWHRERSTGEREGRMAAAGERQIIKGARKVRLSPLLGPGYVLVVLASLPLLAWLPHHRLSGWWAFHWMQWAYSAGFVKGYRSERSSS